MLGHALFRCLLCAMRVVAPMPWSVQRAIGTAAGWLMYRLMRRRRRIADTNLAVCFPHHDQAARSRLVRRHFRSLGFGLVEIALAWYGSDARIMPRGRIVGAEHLQAALAHGRGVIMLSGHFTTFEIGGRIFTSRFKAGATYRPHNNPWWDAAIRVGRGRYVADLIPHRDARAMVRYLRRNHILWYAPDQDFSRARGRNRVFARFFAERASTTTATAWLARTTGARVVPFATYRHPDDSGWEVVLRPALDDFPSGDDLVDAERLNAVLEDQIERSVEQYLWVHRRFKSRPPGMPPVYDDTLLRRRGGNTRESQSNDGRRSREPDRRVG